MSASGYRTHCLSDNQERSVEDSSALLIMTQLDFEKNEESSSLLSSIIAETEREFEKLILII